MRNGLNALNTKNTKDAIGLVAKYTVLILASLAILAPAYIVVLSTFKTTREVLFAPASLPESFSFDNYVEVWTATRFVLYLRNSIIVAAFSVFLTLLATSMASYALSHFNFKIAGLIYLVFIIGLTLPIRLGILPLFITIQTLGLFDTFAALVITFIAAGIPFGILVMTSFMKSVPVELIQAARVDGCGEFRLFLAIVLPILRPALATVAIHNLVLSWNDFFFPLLLTRSETVRTLPLGMSIFFGEYTTEWALLFTGLLLASLPMIVVYSLFTKQFIAGLTTGSIKG